MHPIRNRSTLSFTVIGLVLPSSLLSLAEGRDDSPLTRQRKTEWERERETRREGERERERERETRREGETEEEIKRRNVRKRTG